MPSVLNGSLVKVATPDMLVGSSTFFFFLVKETYQAPNGSNKKNADPVKRIEEDEKGAKRDDQLYFQRCFAANIVKEFMG